MASYTTLYLSLLKTLHAELVDSSSLAAPHYTAAIRALETTTTTDAHFSSVESLSRLGAFTPGIRRKLRILVDAGGGEEAMQRRRVEEVGLLASLDDEWRVRGGGGDSGGVGHQGRRLGASTETETETSASASASTSSGAATAASSSKSKSKSTSTGKSTSTSSSSSSSKSSKGKAPPLFIPAPRSGTWGLLVGLYLLSTEGDGRRSDDTESSDCDDLDDHDHPNKRNKRNRPGKRIDPNNTNQFSNGNNRNSSNSPNQSSNGNNRNSSNNTSRCDNADSTDRSHGTPLYFSKATLIAAAQRYSRASYTYSASRGATAKGGSKYATAWSCMKVLFNRDMVLQRGRPAGYALSRVGWRAAREVVRREGCGGVGSDSDRSRRSRPLDSNNDGGDGGDGGGNDNDRIRRRGRIDDDGGGSESDLRRRRGRVEIYAGREDGGGDEDDDGDENVSDGHPSTRTSKAKATATTATLLQLLDREETPDEDDGESEDGGEDEDEEDGQGSIQSDARVQMPPPPRSHAVPVLTLPKRGSRCRLVLPPRAKANATAMETATGIGEHARCSDGGARRRRASHQDVNADVGADRSPRSHTANLSGRNPNPSDIVAISIDDSDDSIIATSTATEMIRRPANDNQRATKPRTRTMPQLYLPTKRPRTVAGGMDSDKGHDKAASGGRAIASTSVSKSSRVGVGVGVGVDVEVIVIDDDDDE